MASLIASMLSSFSSPSKSFRRRTSSSLSESTSAELGLSVMLGGMSLAAKRGGLDPSWVRLEADLGSYLSGRFRLATLDLGACFGLRRVPDKRAEVRFTIGGFWDLPRRTSWCVNGRGLSSLAAVAVAPVEAWSGGL